MTAPTFTRTWSDRKETHQVNSHVEGGPQKKDNYGYAFEVDHVYGMWTRSSGGPFNSWTLMHVILSGPRILKSGKKSTATRCKWHLDTDQPHKRPDWVNDWLNENEPI